MKVNSILLGILMLLAGATVFVSSWNFSTLPNQSYGSDTMPRAVGLFGLGIGIALVLQGIAAGERRPAGGLTEWTRDPRRLAGMGAAILAVVCYILFSGMTGFLPIAFLLLLGLMLVGGARPIVAIVCAALAALLVQQIFGRFLLVPLPRSDLLNFLW